MDTKIFDNNCITLDGKMDEAVWESVPVYTGFRVLRTRDNRLAPAQTFFRIVPCADRIYIGIKCEEPDMAHTTKVNPLATLWSGDAVEVYLSPSNNYFDFYQFVVGFEGQTSTNFYSEGGNIRPDPYGPQWKTAVYKGEDFWSVEMELPLTAFYMTPNDLWSDTWLVNVCRTRRYLDVTTDRVMFCTWSETEGYKDSKSFRQLPGFPVRPAQDDLHISTAIAEITDENEQGFFGTLTVKTENPEDGEFEFSSDCADTVTVSLKAGSNEFVVPCHFADRGRHRPAMQLKRLYDGKVFKRYYPVRVTYQAIKFSFTLPEYRCNFYPGQDYSKIVGKVVANKPVALKLEGPGIETQTLNPGADGSFCFETPNFEIGDAFLTAATEDRELTQKIRRLAPSEHMMTWISGGNLIVNGKPVLRRTMYGTHYHGGEAFKLRYDADNLYETREICGQKGFITPGRLMKGSDASGGEATKDIKPCDEMFRRVEAVIEDNRDRDFAYYYLDDEPECRGVSPVYLKYLYDFIAEKDPYHAILLGTRSADSFVDCGDWFETHPYINPYTGPDGRRVYGRAINSLGKHIDDIVSLNRSDKCAGFLSTCYGAKRDKPEYYPTFEEYICHTWAAMIRGGKSLWPYAYHDMNDRAGLYEGTRYVFSSFAALEELVLLGKRTTLLKSPDVEAVMYDTGDERMFVLVNMTQDPQKVTIESLSGTWYNFRHNGTITGNHFELQPHEVVIGTSKVRGADLPTYQETFALVEKLEYERTHGGSLLFERDGDLTFTATVSVGGGRKLFDGVKDNYAWECTKKEAKFLEVGLQKVKPTFSKVVIHGFQIDDMTIKVRNGEELSTPAIAEVKTEEFSTTFMLAEPVCPDALRLEFGERRVELYEIEVF